MMTKTRRKETRQRRPVRQYAVAAAPGEHQRSAAAPFEEEERVREEEEARSEI